jgi:4-hydroxy-4-methyl-2-oxoglutarate aldolase
VNQQQSLPDAGVLEELGAFDTCKLADAIERLGLRLRNEGFTLPGLACVTGGHPFIAGYAVTSRVRSADPPMRGTSFRDIADWWSLLAGSPGPRIAVIEDVDARSGEGAVLSNVHAEVLRALGCAGVVTNGGARNVAALSELRFPVFAGHMAISHSYVHMVEFDCAVEIFGLRVEPLDLLCVDVHGALSLPAAHVGDVLRVTREKQAREARIIDLCRMRPFSLDAVRREIHAQEQFQ